jgi:hypothetical protein
MDTIYLTQNLLGTRRRSNKGIVRSHLFVTRYSFVTVAGSVSCYCRHKLALVSNSVLCLRV